MAEPTKKVYIKDQDSVVDLIPQMPHFYLMVGVGITMFKQVWSLAPGSAAVKPFLSMLGTTCVNTAIVGALFNIGYQASATFRSKHDVFNATVGGATVGVFAGLRNTHSGRLHSVIVNAVGLGGLATALTFFGRIPVDYEDKTVEEKLARRFDQYNFGNPSHIYPVRSASYPRKFDYQNKD